MLRSILLAAVVVAVIAVWWQGSEPAAASFEIDKAGVQEKCCFTHPGYSGACEVTPGEDESCSDVLRYLNTPNSQGKTYCGGTNLRGGWKLAACE